MRSEVWPAAASFFIIAYPRYPTRAVRAESFVLAVAPPTALPASSVYHPRHLACVCTVSRCPPNVCIWLSHVDCNASWARRNPPPRASSFSLSTSHTLSNNAVHKGRASRPPRCPTCSRDGLVARLSRCAVIIPPMDTHRRRIADTFCSLWIDRQRPLLLPRRLLPFCTAHRPAGHSRRQPLLLHCARDPTPPSL